jgi:imidazole glycerol phosphate synthase glutamine amidotransferase subunit
VLKAVEYLNFPAQSIDQAAEVRSADKIIFPGQGHFGSMMKGLSEREMLVPLQEAFAEKKPFLGICLGLQALYESSEEAPGVAGLGILPGCVTRFQGVFKVPHVGWSQLVLRPDTKLFHGVPDGSFVYYCHSYYGPVTPEACAITEYGQSFAAGIEMNNIWAVQFHPEKSGEVGLKVLKNFLSL